MVCGPALPADTALVGARAPSRSTYVWILALPVRSSPLGGSSSAPEHRVTSDHQAERSCRAGWDYVHVAVDDASRLAPSTVHADETGRSACRALIQAVGYYRRFGIAIERVTTENGACHKSQRLARLLRSLGIRHVRTKPMPPSPTARSSGLSVLHRAGRLMRTPTHPSTSARSICHIGCIATTGADLMPACTINHPSADSGFP
jgi:hypothetical protein|nr:DDE-type integrase/transposase/recombinase [Algiphilus sp.]